MGNFYQSYEYCQDALGTMAHSMEILLPVMIPLLVAMGGISSGSILDPAVAGAVTGFSALMEHIVLPLVFLSAVFTMINSIHRKGLRKEAGGIPAKGHDFSDRSCRDGIYRDRSDPGHGDQSGRRDPHQHDKIFSGQLRAHRRRLCSRFA